ncbi:MAG: hypothetical protein ACOX4R_07960 [Lentihominibacter sp.]|jgi:methylmalonyl-CoA mutase cobalamin-binding subunit
MSVSGWMSQTNKEYIASLIPENLPNWEDGWKEGFEQGKQIPYCQTRFCKAQGVKDEVEFRLKQAKEGKMTWRIIMGLSSVEEQVRGMKALEKFNEDTGLSVHVAHQVPSLLTATPREKRADVAKALSYLLDYPEDWEKIANCTDIQPGFNDDHIGSPNAYYNTINALKVGNTFNGIVSQFAWGWDGCPDDVENLYENIRAMGLMAAKHKENAVVDSYMDDAIPAYFLDLASYLAWGKMEKYIVSDLCKARYAYSYGHYETKLIAKMALWLAASDLFGSEEQPGLSFIQANSIDHWDQYLDANYGFLIPEALMAILVERKYKTGVSWLTIPITEKVTVPTVEGIINMTAACQRAEEYADDYYKLIDFTEIEKLRDRFKEFADNMFNNMMIGLKEAGVDINNPLELMVVFKRMDPSKIEQFFHPTIANEGKDEIEPLVKATLWERSFKERDEIVSRVDTPSIRTKLKEKEILVVSGDVHSFGGFVITSVLSELGANAVNGGVSIEPIDALDLADEMDIDTICISVHNGQALEYSNIITKLAENRRKKYNMFMGGNLMSFLQEGDTEPGDATELIEKTGIKTTETADKLVALLADNV